MLLSRYTHSCSLRCTPSPADVCKKLRVSSLYLEHMTDGEVRSAKAMAEDPYWIWVRGEVEEGEQQFKQAFEEKVNKIKKAQEAQYGEYLQDKEARNKKAFAVLDVNGDGKLQEQEVVDALTPGHDKHFELREALGLMSRARKALGVTAAELLKSRRLRPWHASRSICG